MTDLLKRDAAFVKETLDTGGVIMICGMLSMYKDVVRVDSMESMPFSTAYYKASGQFFSRLFLK